MFPVVSAVGSQQVQFDFTPGVTERFRSLKEVVVAVAHNASCKQSTIAAACDVSPSEFSKSMSGAEGRRFDVDWLEQTMKETGDLRPLYYLMEKFLESPEAKRNRAIAELASIAKVLPDLLKKAGAK